MPAIRRAPLVSPAARAPRIDHPTPTTTARIGESSSADTHAFEVTGTGEVTETVPFLNGTGTTLTVIGYPIDIDAGAMPDGSFFFVGGIGGFLSDEVATFTFLPGVKSIEDGSSDENLFEVLTANGLLDYASSLEGILLGEGTDRLIFDPSFAPTP